MLELFKRYRANPKRTVLVMKNVRSFYLQKRADTHENGAECDAYTNANNVSLPTKTPLEANFFEGNEYVLERDNLCDNDDKFAFKSYDNTYSLDSCLTEKSVLESDNKAKFSSLDQGGCKLNKNTKSFLKCAIKPLEKHTKGTLVCEKTWKVLLCDLVAGLGVVLLVCTVFSRLFGGKDRNS